MQQDGNPDDVTSTIDQSPAVLMIELPSLTDHITETFPSASWTPSKLDDDRHPKRSRSEGSQQDEVLVGGGGGEVGGGSQLGKKDAVIVLNPRTLLDGMRQWHSFSASTSPQAVSPRKQCGWFASCFSAKFCHCSYCKLLS